MFSKKNSCDKKVTKGFTLVEIIVVLVILAILAAATIPSMLGFVNDAKQKSLASEVRAVYTAAQAYATEHYNSGDSTVESEINGVINSSHKLYNLLGNDADGKVAHTRVKRGKVTSFTYTKNGVGIKYETGSGTNSLKAQKFADIMGPEEGFSGAENFNAKIKTLAGHENPNRGTEDNFITGIVRKDSLSDAVSNVDDPRYIISANDSDYRIWAWFENGEICYYTEADVIFLPRNMSNMFRRLKALSNISVLSTWDASMVNDAYFMFMHCVVLSDISPTANWDFSNVKDMNQAFLNCAAIEDATCLNAWKVPSSCSLDETFNGTPARTNDKLPTWYHE